MGTKPNPPIQPDPNNPSPLPPKTEPIPATRKPKTPRVISDEQVKRYKDTEGHAGAL